MCLVVDSTLGLGRTWVLARLHHFASVVLSFPGSLGECSQVSFFPFFFPHMAQRERERESTVLRTIAVHV